ncbi:MauE/DoxX family redox-associated membrane protein [Mucilaginibacter segetis]|uniref:Methylamine utilisation protein MauE domain-containing protein n=1 Tax=Mucilaginibacter segetis TaxID=2793071 RepID=A0A934PPV5_9SPHI|nr:MauE/DoxX family redox-associated membrane protein [Mucilaginibacter segetis]MBK0378543.1 hypothetical protein [Mucilaginibacter segetis]
MKKNHTAINTCAAALILLFIYTASAKLIDFRSFRTALSRQLLPAGFSRWLAWILPGAELLTAALLTFERSRSTGFGLAAVLMFAFTAYVGLALTGAYGQVPCSCGGVLPAMGWELHFWFNCFFLALSCIGLWLQRKEVNAIQ